MAKKKSSSSSSTAQSPLFRAMLWAAIAAVWLLVSAALISYNPADPPSTTVAPLNVKPANWAGKIGAAIAHHTYLMLGPGVWVMVAGWGTYLLMALTGRPRQALTRRLIGLLLMTIAASSLLAIAAPTLFARPEGSGGLVAIFINAKMLPLLNVLGTLLVMTLTFLVGSLLAADQAVLTLSHHFGRLCMNIANIRVPRPVLVGALNGIKGFPGMIRRGLEEANAPAATDKAGKKRGPRKSETDGGSDSDENRISPDAGGLGGTEAFDPDGPRKGRGKRAVSDADEYDYVYTDDEEVKAEIDDESKTSAAAKAGEKTSGKAAAASEGASTSASADDDDANAGADSAEGDGSHGEPVKQFTPDELRAKIKKLPINFAPKNKPQPAPAREVDLTGYRFPGLDMLVEPESNFTEEQEKVVREQALALEQALQQYRIEGEVVGIDSGPVITLFEVRLAAGTKVSRLNTVSSDLARALKAQNIRIVPNTAGKDTIGVEVPNINKERVRLKELMTVNAEAVSKMKLPMFLGKDASGNPLIQDLSQMPHMLIAGTTGSGKSVCMNSIIMSFLYTKRPDELKLVLVDPKMVELSMFKDIPHLMCPVVTEMGKAAAILEWAVTKMDERYELLLEAGVRDIGGYNVLTREELKERFQPSSEEEEAKIPKKLPYMVFVIDELADLMMTNKEVESFIVRIAQKARAVGIHLILATQRPQANVVTGLIKGNMPCRVCFKVASGLDSRIILDQKGGELLLGHGDMLFLSPRSSKLFRAQGTLLDDMEIRKVVKFLKEIAQQNFEPQLMQLKQPGAIEGESSERDPLFDDAVRVVLETQRGSVSLLQRRLTIGYSRSSRLIEEMAQAGILGDYKGSQARECNITLEEWEALKAQAAADAAVQVHGNLDAEGHDAAEKADDAFDADADSDDEDDKKNAA